VLKIGKGKEEEEDQSALFQLLAKKLDFTTCEINGRIMPLLKSCKMLFFEFPTFLDFVLF